MAISEDTWARLRQQVEAAQGETIVAAETRRKHEFHAAVKATGWDGSRCCVDPHKVYAADPIHVYRVLEFWRGLVRAEYALTGDVCLKAEPHLTWAFNAGCAPCDARVTRILADANGAPVWTRRAAREAARNLRKLFTEAATFAEAAA